jgi:dihydroorotate dehydrogenase (NAD+) catalytic subunit
MPGIDGFELNVSCPNVKAGGLEFGADQRALAALVAAARGKTPRPIFVKLSPTLGAGIADTAKVAVDAGATGLTLVNTMPGLVIDTHRRKPKISFGSGGLSGPAVLPIGLLATWRVSQALPGVPLIGLGGVSTGDDAVQYLLAGASLVGVGTAALRDPRAPERIARQMAAWAQREGVRDLPSIIGTLQWPS